jgi:serine/threonine-protein kinase TTK/MPS1
MAHYTEDDEDTNYESENIFFMVSEEVGNTLCVNGKSYTILNFLGNGGSSEVYKAQNEEDQSFVAIKKVYLTDPLSAENFMEEVKILNMLQESPRVVKLFDHEQVLMNDKTLILYEVLELGDTDLQQYLDLRKAQGERLTDQETKNLWLQMLEAVQHIHSAGVLHLDLKPANFIMVGGQLKLIDFGLSLAVNNPDDLKIWRSTACGTWLFASPEAMTNTNSASGHLVSDKSDIWSLGCILYLMIHEELPMEDLKMRNPQSIANAVLTEPIVFTRNVGEHDHRINQVLRKCLHKNPLSRPSVLELLKLPYIKNFASQ